MGGTTVRRSAFDVRRLSFEFAGAASDGLALWREQQQETLRRLGAELGLPLGALCEVVIATGLLVRGRLLLDHTRRQRLPATGYGMSGSGFEPKFRSLDSFSSSSSSSVLDATAFLAAKRARFSRNYFVPLFWS
jgi:hypothetical protein